MNRFLAPSLLLVGLATAQDITYLRFAFCGCLGDFKPGRLLDTGIVRTVWLTAEEIRQSTHRHRSSMVLRCIEDYLLGRRYPLALVTTDASALFSANCS